MDTTRFDDLTRALGSASSRRGALGALLAGSLAALGPLVGETRKKKKKKKKKKNSRGSCTPNCSDRACGNDGCGGSCGTCRANQTCQGGTCCTPEPLATTCGELCGTRTNNCGQSVTCPICPDDQECLGNGTCAAVCLDGDDCPFIVGEFCDCLPAVDGGPKKCILTGPCEDNPQVCSSTADCPPGQICVDPSCPAPGSKRCYTLCPED